MPLLLLKSKSKQRIAKYAITCEQGKEEFTQQTCTLLLGGKTGKKKKGEKKRREGKKERKK